jgi:hypothetical protein
MEEDRRTLRPSPVSYEIIEYEGQAARRYSSGEIRNNKGQILYTPTHVARERLRIKAVRAMERAQEGLKLATQSESAEEGWMKVVRARVHVAMTDQGRAGNDAAKLVGQATGFLIPERKVEVEGEVMHRPALPEFPKEYLDFLKKLSQRETVEGKVIYDDDQESD